MQIVHTQLTFRELLCGKYIGYTDSCCVDKVKHELISDIRVVDVWGVGCIFAEMLLGVPIFLGSSEKDQVFGGVMVIEVTSLLPRRKRERSGNFRSYGYLGSLFSPFKRINTLFNRTVIVVGVTTLVGLEEKESVTDI
jgi:hypothetical protein